MTTAIGALLVLLGSAVPATERALQVTGTRSPAGPTQHSTSRSLALAQVALGIDQGMDVVAGATFPAGRSGGHRPREGPMLGRGSDSDAGSGRGRATPEEDLGGRGVGVRRW